MLDSLNRFLQKRRDEIQVYNLDFNSFRISFLVRLMFVFAFSLGLPLYVGSFVEKHISQMLGSILTMVLVPISLFLLFKFKLFRVYRKPYLKAIRSVWFDNGLVSTEKVVTKSVDSKGVTHDKVRTQITDFLPAVIWANSPKAIFPFFKIELRKNGSHFQSMITPDLIDKISAVIGLPLDEEQDSITSHTLIFKPSPVQDVIPDDYFTRGRDTAEKVYFYHQNCWDLTKAFSALISGVSGSGKSYFTYTILTSFLNQRVYDREEHCYHNNLIYLIDPKESDLYKIASKSMPKEYYGSSKGDAFRIIRAFNDEMVRRKESYKNIEDFDTVLTDTGLFAPKLLVIEEFASLMSSFSKKERDDFSDLLKGILFQGRQLGLGVLLISQKLNSEVISVSVRENLNYKFLLGKSFSNELADTMFGSHQDLPKPPDSMGSGLFAVDSEGGIVRKFIAPRFEGDLFATILPVWKSAYEEEDSRLSMITDEQSVRV